MMAPFLILLATIFLAFSSSSLASNSNFPASAISGAPAFSPPSPSSSPPPAFSPPSVSSTPTPPPALSPDITPLFPTPGGPQLSPTESSLPIIPSSPSPPKPDDDDAMEAPGPGIAVAPSRLLPDSSSLRVVNGGGFMSSVVVVSGLVAFGLM